MIPNISKLNIGSQTLLRYADLDYDEWYAMSEFVDNSLHSFLQHKPDLEALGYNICNVHISIDRDESEAINIHDDSGGIHKDEFQRLLSLGIKKEQCDVQLSEFGMGMKTAAFWFGRHIEIETKHFTSDECFSITIDLDKLGTENEVQIKPVRASSNHKGYTKIRITQLNRSLSRKKSKIKEALASIYRKYIETEQININFEGETLRPYTFTLLKQADGSELRKDVIITLKNGKKAKGWLGVMDVGKTVYSGFSVYRNNRLIQGYPDNAWRPIELFGQEGGSNSRKNQTLVGELDMTEFQVAHTKNKVNFVGDEDAEFRKILKEEFAEIQREGNKTKAERSEQEHQAEPRTQIAKKDLERFFQQPENTDITSIEFISPTIKSKAPEKVRELYNNSDPYIDWKDLANTQIAKGVLIYHFKDATLPYMIMDTIDEILCVCINIDHPYYIIKDISTESQLEYVTNCIFDALTEDHNIRKYGTYTPEDARITKDLFMKRWIDAVNQN